MCRFQYTPFVNLVQHTRRWQWFTEGSWEFNRGLRLSGELLVAETYVPNWTTSPSYPPSDVIDPARRIQAGHPALVDMTSKYPDLYGDYAYCAAEHCRWRGDGAEQDAAGVPHRWQAVAWINGRHFGQNGPFRDHPRRSATQRAVVRVEGDWGTASWGTALTYARNRRQEEDGAGLHYRSLRALLGLGGYDCEDAGFGEQALPLADGVDARLSLRYEDYPQQGLSSLDPAAYKHDANTGPPIDAHTTHDITASWALLDDRAVLDAAVFNLGDREPPRVYRQLNYDPLTHNPLGRIVQLGVRWRW